MSIHRVGRCSQQPVLFFAGKRAIEIVQEQRFQISVARHERVAQLAAQPRAQKRRRGRLRTNPAPQWRRKKSISRDHSAGSAGSSDSARSRRTTRRCPRRSAPLSHARAASFETKYSDTLEGQAIGSSSCQMKLRQRGKEIVHRDHRLVMLGSDRLRHLRGVAQFAELLLCIANREGLDWLRW